MDRQRWQRLSQLLDEALALAGAERAGWLQRLREREPAIADELQSMLGEADDEAATGSLGAFEQYLAPALVTTTMNLRGRRLGAWQIEEKIGEGGMGQVWRATRADGLYDAEAAIKLLRSDLPASSLKARFARERAVLARLAHPAIARLLDAGIADGQAYLVLELVQGRTLSDHVRESVPAVADRVRLFLRIAQAVDYAHAQLIVHRDLKPSNVVVTAAGEPKLLDFGIAALLDAESGGPGDGELTRQFGRGLTVGYAAPEQVIGAPIGTAADVFSLGVMLYEQLTGELPFGRRLQGRAAAEHALLHDAPTHFREHTRRSTAARRGDTNAAPPTVDPPGGATLHGLAPGPGRPADAERAYGDLEAVVAKALRKAPAERYGSVRELIVDLERWLDHRPVSVRREHWQHNLRLWFARHALLAGSLGAVGITLLAGLTVATWQWRRAEEAGRQSQIVTRYLTEMLAEASPDRHGGQWPTVLQLLDRSRAEVGARFADAPEARLRVMETLISTYSQLNRFDLSMPLAEEWVALTAARYGDDHPRTLEARIEQARSYQIQGLFDKAVAIGEPALPKVRRSFGADAEALRTLVYVLVACYTRTGRLDDAERLLGEGAQMIARTFPRDHPIHGSHLNHVQVLRNGQGRLREALEAMQATQRWWADPPPDHVREVLVWRRNTLAIQIRLAEYAGVEERTRALLADMDRVLGAGNDMALGMRAELARLFTEIGVPAKAHAERVEALRVARSQAVQHVALLLPLRAQAFVAAAQAQLLEPAELRRDGRALLDETVAQAQAIGHPRSEIFIAVARAALALDDAGLAADALARMTADAGLRLDSDRLLAARKSQLDGQLARLRGDFATSRALLQSRRELFDRLAERRVVPGWSAAIDLAYTLVLQGDAGAAGALDDATGRRPATVPAGHPLDAAVAYLRARLTNGEAHPATREALAELARRQGRRGEPGPAGLGSLRGAIF